MKSAGSAIIAVIVAIIAIWLFIALLGVALKLVGILLGLGLAVVAYFAAERLLTGGRRA
jgi:hypothetical protein